MRAIGYIPDEQRSRRFADYLLSLGIKSSTEAESEGWVVWIYDEDHVERSKDELAEFNARPDDARYVQAEKQAAKRKKEEEKKHQAAQKNQVDVRRQWRRPPEQSCPATYVLIWMSVIVVIAGSSWENLWTLCDRTEPLLTHLFIVPMFEADGGRVWYPSRGLDSVWKGGEVWRLVTPIFLHFSLLHILFNMMWLRELGTAIEYRRGTFRFVVLVLTIAAVSNLAQYGARGPAFGGMSGVVFGLFGYIWMKSRYQPEAGFYLFPNTVFWMMAWFFLCMTGAVGAIANYAHGVGLAAGCVIGYAPVLWRRAT